MKCRGQVVFQQSLESVFAWLAQPEHIVQLITCGNFKPYRKIMILNPRYRVKSSIFNVSI